MPIPGVHIETLATPQEYDWRQIEQAAQIAGHLNRGKLLLLIAPEPKQ